MPTNTKRRYFLLFASLTLITSIAVLILSSCHKTDMKVDQQKQNSELINNAKKWFTEKTDTHPEIWGKNKNKLDWDGSFIITTSTKINYVIVPY